MEKENLALTVDNLSEKYPAAPLTSPEQIENKTHQGVVIDLVKVGSNYVPSTVEPYYLPKQSKVKDPRRIWRRIKDRFLLKVSSDKRKIEERIKTAKTLAKVEAKYNWLKSSFEVVDAAVNILRDSYQNIAKYHNNVQEGIRKAGELTEDNEKTIAHLIKEVE